MKTLFSIAIAAIIFGGCNNSTEPATPRPTIVKSAFRYAGNDSARIHQYIRSLRGTNRNTILYSKDLEDICYDNRENIIYRDANYTFNGNAVGIKPFLYPITVSNPSPDAFIAQVEKHRKAYPGGAYNSQFEQTYGMYTQLIWSDVSWYSILIINTTDNKSYWCIVVDGKNSSDGNENGELP